MLLPTPIDAVFTLEADSTIKKMMVLDKSLAFPNFCDVRFEKLPMAYGKLPMPTFAIDGYAMEKTVIIVTMNVVY